MSVVVVAEKPSVARDIAEVLGARTRRKGYLEGGGYRVTWAVGHLVGLAQPHEIDPRWKAWRADRLPMLPKAFPLAVLEGTRDQYEVVASLLNDPSTAEVVAATDAGREGELIFRYIYEKAGCRKPVRRLWISSLTPEAIQQGFARLAPASKYDGLAAAAVGRSRADWLVGMNLSRAYTLAYDDQLSVGRVQTPTLSMVVDRELAIRDFVPEAYQEVRATFEHAAGRYEGTWTRPKGASKDGAEGDEGTLASRLPADGAEAAAIVARVLAGAASVQLVERRTRRLPPERLYDLTELQRHANRLYGFSAKKTLELAQELYEKHKALSYPRTDCRHLSTEVAGTLPGVVEVIAGRYPGLVAAGTGKGALGPRFVDDAKITDHHAIIPTPTRPKGFGPGSDLGKIYDLVCRRLLAAWHADHVDAVTTVRTEVRSAASEARGDGVVDIFLSRGTSVEQEGWKVLDPPSPRGAPSDEPRLPAGLEAGQPAQVAEVKAVDKKTRPPRPFTDSTLLTAMETAGRQLDDAALSEVMRGSGIGTPATRAATIETLLARQYLRREGKSLRATDKGIRLIEVVHEQVKSPAMTGAWELRLQTMEQHPDELPAFVQGIEAYVSEVVAKLRDGRGGPVARRPSAGASTAGDAVARRRGAGASTAGGDRARRPSAGASTAGGDGARRPSAGASTAGGEAHAPRTLAATLRAGEDALVIGTVDDGGPFAALAMLGGPVVALTADVGSARALAARATSAGLAAEALHEGLDREASRAICRAFLKGSTAVLAVDAATLAVAGVPAMLEKRRPRAVVLPSFDARGDGAPTPPAVAEVLARLRPAPALFWASRDAGGSLDAWARGLGGKAPTRVAVLPPRRRGAKKS